MSDPTIEKAKEDLIAALMSREAMKQELFETKRCYELASYKYKAARSRFVQAYVAIHGGIHKLISADSSPVGAASITSFGERLKSIRGDMSREEFSPLTGVCKTSLVSYEKNEREPGAVFLRKILALFPDINPTWLLTGEGNKTRRTIEGL